MADARPRQPTLRYGTAMVQSLSYRVSSASTIEYDAIQVPGN